MTKADILSLIVSSIALFISIITVIITRKQKNQILLYDQMQKHAKDENFMATKRLWELYRECGNQIGKKYIEIMDEEDLAMQALDKSEKMEFLHNSLHFQRKQLTQFWRNIAIYMINGLLPRRQVYNAWARSTVEIIPKILLPIEKEMAKKLNSAEFNEKSEPLFFWLRKSISSIIRVNDIFPLTKILQCFTEAGFSIAILILAERLQCSLRFDD